MRYVLIPCPETVVTISATALQRNADEFGDGQYDALAQAFERTIQTYALLVTYARAVAGKPSTQ